MEGIKEPKAEMAGENCFPRLVLRRVFANLGARDALAASQTCVQWRQIGVATRQRVRVMRISDFYADLITEDRFVERPIFHGREDLHGLVLIRMACLQDLLGWLCALFPDITNLVFRNCVRRENSAGPTPHPSQLHVFIISELMRRVLVCWLRVETLDVGGEIVDVPALRKVKLWPNFRELHISGADLSYNMLKKHRLVSGSLSKTFLAFPLESLRMSNMDTIFDLKCTQLTVQAAHLRVLERNVKAALEAALNHTSLTTRWLNDFLEKAVNLRTLAMHCQYLHDENIILIGNLVELRELVLRNCRYVQDFGPLGKLHLLETVIIDCGDKGTEEQMCRIVVGSKHWRRIVFNELVESVGDRFLFVCADHVSRRGCPIVQFELNTEKKEFPGVGHNRVLPLADTLGVGSVLEVCPLLEIFGICSRRFDDSCLLRVVEHCPRITKVRLYDSAVTDEGVLTLLEVLFRKRTRKFFGCKSGYFCIVAQDSNCTPALLEKAKRVEGRFEIIL